MARIDGVRDYNRIRRFLSHIYLYGFFSREDFARCGIGSVQDYDYGTRLVRSVFPDSEDAALWQEGRKYLRIRRQYARQARMTDSYCLHAMDAEEDLPAHMALLSALGRGPQTLEALCAAVELRLPDGEVSQYHKTRRMLLALAEYGYVEKQGKLWRLANGLGEDLAGPLYNFVRFAGTVGYPRTAGTYLSRCLERTLLRQGMHPAEEPLVLPRHNIVYGVFDEDLVYQLLDAIAARRTVTLTLGGKIRSGVVPAAVRADTRLGRWYLLAMGAEGPFLVRLSFIHAVKAGAALTKEQWRKARETVLAAFAASGCSGAIPEKGTVLVEARLRFDRAPGMRAQFIREMRMGSVERHGEGEIYRAQVNDPLELLPFLRSYAPWIQILPGEHGLDRRLREDLKAMRKALEDGR